MMLHLHNHTIIIPAVKGGARNFGKFGLYLEMAGTPVHICTHDHAAKLSHVLYMVFTVPWLVFLVYDSL